MNQYKKNLIDSLDMLSNIERQKRYHEEVPIADVPCELISAWFDDGFYIDDDEFKGLFSIEEWMILLEFNDFYESKLNNLPNEFSKLVVDGNWLEITYKAKQTLKKLGWDNN